MELGCVDWSVGSPQTLDPGVAVGTIFDQMQRAARGGFDLPAMALHECEFPPQPGKRRIRLTLPHGELATFEETAGIIAATARLEVAEVDDAEMVNAKGSLA